MTINDIKLNKVSDRVWYMDSWEDYDWCTIGLVIGDSHVMMLDAGASRRHVELFMQKLEENNLPKPDLCAITHWHWDHTYGLAHLQGVTSFANRDTNNLLEKMKGWGWSDEEMKERIASGEDLAFSYPNQNAEYPDKSLIKVATATVEYQDKLDIDLGGVHIRLKKIENSHSYDCSVIYIREEKTIFLGDIRYHDLLPLTPVYHADLHEKLLTGLRKFDFDKVISGHQPLLTAEELYSMLAQAEPIVDY